MTETPLVRINVDPAEKIAKLYGIGLARAKKIVRYRESKGPFQTPEDLAQVDSIGLDLAITLAPHINWEKPSPPEEPIKRDWLWAFISALCIFYFSQTIARSILPALYGALNDYHAGIPHAWTDIWAMISKMVLAVFFVAGLFFTMLGLLSTSPVNGKRFNQIAWGSGGMGVLGGASIYVGRILKYQLYDRAGWAAYWADPTHQAAILGMISLILLFLPIFLVLWKPSLRSSIRLVRSFDLAIVTAAPLVAFGIWANRGDWPIGFSVLNGFLGAWFGYVGITTLRTGESLFFQTIDSLLNPGAMTSNLSGRDNWQAWINARLPDPEQQKALMQTLKETYPPTKFRTISGAIVLGAGGWILLTALGAVVQWFVEKGLDRVWSF